MMTHKALFVFALVLVSANAASISFVDNAWNEAPESISMEHILNILRHSLGEATPSQIKHSLEYLKKLNPTDIKNKVSVYLMDIAKSPSDLLSVPITNYIQASLPSKSWLKVVDSNSSEANSQSGVTITEGWNLTVQDIVSGSQTESSKIIIWGTAAEHQKVQSSVSSPKRLLQTVTDSSYLIKFFFCVMFILITFGVLYSISDMKNQRDTLLYAKFVADVGGR